ncbi:MAG: CDP-alcohol phosphatidyltransferase family protein [Candidatus Krumholzibacteriota bacterium]|nr:CDP-alcohol phosphatidyltransferase family protein [Candidatus Krumholzibacteriota bacterium]
MRFVLSSVSILLAGSLLISIYYDRFLGRDIFLYTLPLLLALSGFAFWKTDLFIRPDGSFVSGFQAANILTSIRLLLVGPIVVLFGYGLEGIATILYMLILISDVADGIIARRFDQGTAFGVMLDPFADIASTVAVFVWLLIKGLVPLWLLILLIVRYSEFFAGLFFLTLIKRPPRLRATKPGKMAGLILGIGVMVILLKRIFSFDLPLHNIDYYIFAAMAAAFAIVIVSQTRIGLEAVRRKTDDEAGGR